MLKVLAKAIYTDGSLFQVKDDRTGEVRLLSEPSLGKYTEAKRVSNASVVHREGARTFVRLASGVPTKEVATAIPQFKSDYDNEEAVRAKKWFILTNAKPSNADVGASVATETVKKSSLFENNDTNEIVDVSEKEPVWYVNVCDIGAYQKYTDNVTGSELYLGVSGEISNDKHGDRRYHFFLDEERTLPLKDGDYIISFTDIWSDKADGGGWYWEPDFPVKIDGKLYDAAKLNYVCGKHIPSVSNVLWKYREYFTSEGCGESAYIAITDEEAKYIESYNDGECAHWVQYYAGTTQQVVDMERACDDVSIFYDRTCEVVILGGRGGIQRLICDDESELYQRRLRWGFEDYVRVKNPSGGHFVVEEVISVDDFHYTDEDEDEDGDEDE